VGGPGGESLGIKCRGMQHLEARIQFRLQSACQLGEGNCGWHGRAGLLSRSHESGVVLRGGESDGSCPIGWRIGNIQENRGWGGYLMQF
jgi:hypothetical protein